MPLTRLPIDDVRNLCRHRLESLELWLKRLIHDKLSAEFGPDYFTQSQNGNHIFSASVRRQAEPVGWASAHQSSASSSAQEVSENGVSPIIPRSHGSNSIEG